MDFGGRVGSKNHLIRGESPAVTRTLTRMEGAAGFDPVIQGLAGPAPYRLATPPFIRSVPPPPKRCPHRGIRLSGIILHFLFVSVNLITKRIVRMIVRMIVRLQTRAIS